MTRLKTIRKKEMFQGSSSSTQAMWQKKPVYGNLGGSTKKNLPGYKLR